MSQEHDQTAQSLEHIETQLADYAQQQQRLLDLYIRGQIDEGMFSRTKTGLDQAIGPLEALRAELQSRISSQNAQQMQVESTINYVRHIVKELPQASIEERCRVIEALDVHAVYRSLDQIRIFFDLPVTEGQTDEDVEEFRWQGPETVAAIRWGDSMSTASN